MINKKLKRLLKKSKGAKTVYGISKALGISPQAGDYVVKRKNLAKDFERLQRIADYMGVDITDIVDYKKKSKD
ncbi:helix-turn-helix domain-containing protein [uncultured Aquimarina sp.]|uniref:helix-turn-helix domain-containing protein n=1 Tax=uncultured Aquimarina sp. TaxID=575652 RepID=UPI0026113D43|nr:helix-turn-helix domain-containing protein [uncultured Aquimarina sp.]